MLDSAEIALCVVIPLLILSIVSLIFCYLYNKRSWCFKQTDETQLLASNVSRNPIDNIDHQTQDKIFQENSSFSMIKPKYTENIEKQQPVMTSSFVATEQMTSSDEWKKRKSMTGTAETTSENSSARSSVHQVQTTRRRSMQVPIDIRLIDPKLYGSVKAASFDAEVGDDDDVTRPLLHFAIEYSVDAEELMVKLIQARNLEAAGGQPVINPYLSIELMPDYVRRRSRVHQSTRDPEFAESFTFPLLHDEIDDKTLRIRVFNAEQFARDECCGEVQLRLKEIDFELLRFQPLVMWRIVHTSSVDMTVTSSLTRPRGDLLLSLSYLPSAEKLTITLQKARNLSLSRVPKPDAFVKVILLKSGKRIKKRKTRVVPSCRDPSFGEALTFPLSLNNLKSRDVTVICHVIHVTKIGNNIVIGRLHLGLSSGDTEQRQHWAELIQNPSNTPIARWHTLRGQHDSSSSTSSQS